MAYRYAKQHAYLTGVEPDQNTLRQIVEQRLAGYFRPSPSCGEIVADAKERKLWRQFDQHAVLHSGAAIRPGDPVLFDWCGSGGPAHVGLFIAQEGAELLTVEFNTTSGSGGAQSENRGCFIRLREPRFVLGSVIVNR